MWSLWRGCEIVYGPLPQTAIPISRAALLAKRESPA